MTLSIRSSWLSEETRPGRAMSGTQVLKAGLGWAHTAQVGQEDCLEAGAWAACWAMSQRLGARWPHGSLRVEWTRALTDHWLSWGCHQRRGRQHKGPGRPCVRLKDWDFILKAIGKGVTSGWATEGFWPRKETPTDLCLRAIALASV